MFATGSCFLKAFGFAKTKRFGHEVGSSLPLNPTEDNMVTDDYSSVLKARLHMRGFFEHNFYGNNFKYLPTGVRWQRRSVVVHATVSAHVACWAAKAKPRQATHAP